MNTPINPKLVGLLVEKKFDSKIIMNKEFVPYTEALELKQLGFDEPCFGWFASDKSLVKDITIKTDFTLAPIFSQCFRWFREKYSSHYSIVRIPQKAIEASINQGNTLKKYSWYISNDSLNPSIPKDCSGKADEYEEAELACLKKLIELIKNVQT